MKSKTPIAILIVGILLIVGAGYHFYSKTVRGPERIACTAEALLCPDGSGVGRTGPKCEFSACPNQPSFVGTLRRDSNGFSIVLPSPANGGGMEVAYAMPLILKDSTAASQLVGQKVEVFGVFTHGVTLSVERLEALSGDASNPEVGEIRVGETGFINGVRITFNSIVQDSRCPVDVQCIQAGWVTANVTLQSNTDKETKDIASNEAPTAFDSYQISIEDIKPTRMSTFNPLPGSYTLTFKVVSN